MHYVYVLRLATGEFYKGLTNNLDRRIRQHEVGNVDATRSKLPLMLVHVEICLNRKIARTLEKFFKSGYGREVIKEIYAEVVEW